MQSDTAALTRALDRLGVKQTVVTARPPGAPPRAPLAGRAEVVRLGWPVPWMRQLYSVQAAALVGSPWPAADIVHVHLGEDLAIVPLGLLAMWVRGAPMILTIHCSLTHTFAGTGARGLALRSLGGWLERLGARRAAAVIALTDRTARALRSGMEPDRVHVIPSGVESRRFRGSPPDPLPRVSRPRVIFVGRLVQEKGVSRLIDAIPHLASPADVVLVGDGPQRGALEKTGFGS